METDCTCELCNELKARTNLVALKGTSYLRTMKVETSDNVQGYVRVNGKTLPVQQTQGRWHQKNMSFTAVYRAFTKGKVL